MAWDAHEMPKLHDSKRGKSNGTAELRTASLFDFLDSDDKPTFIVDLKPDLNPRPRIVFCNRALKAADGLRVFDLSSASFKLGDDITQWIDFPRGPFESQQHAWTSFVYGKRWRVFSGLPLEPRDLRNARDAKNAASHEAPRPSARALLEDSVMQWKVTNTGLESEMLAPFTFPGAVIDWTRTLPPSDPSAHIQLVRAFDWSTTSFGSMDTWTADFRQLANIITSSPNPTLMTALDGMHSMYNEFYGDILGYAHPQTLGHATKDVFPDGWAHARKLVYESYLSGKALKCQSSSFEMQRRPHVMDETFFAFNLIPIIDRTSGRARYLLWMAEETTTKVLAERRAATIRSVAHATADAKSVEEYWQKLLSALALVTHKHEIPFARLYTRSSERTGRLSSESSVSMFPPFTLEGFVAEPACLLAKTTLSTDQLHNQKWWSEPFRECHDTCKPTVLHAPSTRNSLQIGPAEKGEDQYTMATLCPIRSPHDKHGVIGILLVGINPLRPYDAGYEEFMDGLSAQVTSSLASVALIEEEKSLADQAIRHASLVKSKLSMQLASAQEGEAQFKKLSEIVSVGMTVMDLEGKSIYCNRYWYELTDSGPEQAMTPMGFLHCIEEIDHPIMWHTWKRLTEERVPVTWEVRIKRRWHAKDLNGHEIDGPTWVLGNAQPEARDGQTKLFVVITEISRQKWAENHQMLQRMAAMEMQARLESSERKFQRMADVSQVAMFVLSETGDVLYANDMWYSLTQLSRGQEITPALWIEALLEEDRERAMKTLGMLTTERKSVHTEFRMRKPWSGARDMPGGRGDGITWVIAEGTPVLNSSGDVEMIMGSLTDISAQKWAAQYQEQRSDEARHAKQQQERFIDMVSHEMRNPLSAIIQSADVIMTTTLPATISEAILEAADTIALCAQHQKRIIDDILTLSRLDSNLLLVTPVESDPVVVVSRVLKMLVLEMESSSIQLVTSIGSGYHMLDIDRVTMDPSRLIQILVNLIGNAMKFTRMEKEPRRITVTVDASIEKPVGPVNGFRYLRSGMEEQDPTVDTAWGDGACVYLQFIVEDTGKGLTEDEMALLFQRYTQANPKTHVEYGGSGLGLFISRELTEKQGGQIGMASQAGVGSMFAFYIKARRAPSLDATMVVPDDADFFNAHQITDQNQNRKRKLSRPLPSATSRHLMPTISSPEGHPRRCLVVEDNLVNQRVLSKGLERAGWHVDVANHGAEAMAYLLTSRFSRQRATSTAAAMHERCVVLMDLEMPVMDGMTCVKEIRRLEQEVELHHVPVIAVTANARPEQIQEALSAGMDVVVPKPFRIPDLIPLMLKQMDTLSGGESG